MLGFLAGAAAAGLLTYGAVGSAGQALGLQDVRAGLPLAAASGVFLAAWHGWGRTRPRAAAGRQISKRLARARTAGPLAYGAVLGVGVLTIVATPAVWLGVACCFAVGDTAWGGVYGLSFGTGRALMLMHDSRRSRGMPTGNITFLVVERQFNPRSRFQWWGLAGGLALAGLAAAAAAAG